MTAVFDLLAQSPVFFLTLVFIVSLMVGSFLNVVIYRVPIMMERSWQREYQDYFGNDSTDESQQTPETFNLVKPDSTCPKCGHKIRAWENIPVVSWLLLRGKCSNCKTSIGSRYPLVELLTALLSVWVAAHYGYGSEALLGIIVTWVLVALTFIDADKMLLPDELTLPLLWLGLGASVFTIFVPSSTAIIGATAGYLSLWSVYWLFKLVTGKEGMGYGDFKLLAALGAFVGWQGLPVIIILSSLVGAIVGIALITLRRNESSQAIPFGPYLAVAGWLTLLYGETIQQAYLAWVLQ
ncbi:A24 family peptidase [Alteromonas sp. ASW11-36]|uniref:Prepilin leader peptidase/N-methyltransferase n=1 Tax=Alteromonas arenosi TaxID=3055817 RepID=A0ABT7STN8_9ALTE|nr:A24 family peptidase [Alteromonas sp. ASW11-36]MDM7859545.1 A24 family peptidase [Alteromonas sp. ASW11-36]